MSYFKNQWQRAAAAVATAALAGTLTASCSKDGGGTPTSPSTPSTPTTPAAPATPVPPATPTGMTAQQKSDYYRAVLFNEGPDGGGGSCKPDVKTRWSDSVKDVDVAISARASDAQKNSFLSTLNQFNDIMGGGFNFKSRTADFPIDQFAAPGQIILHVDDDVSSICQSSDAVACAGGYRSLDSNPRERSSITIWTKTSANAMGHELMHGFFDACHTNGGVVSGITGDRPTFENNDMSALKEAREKGVLRPGSTKQDFVVAGLIIP